LTSGRAPTRSDEALWFLVAALTSFLFGCGGVFADTAGTYDCTILNTVGIYNVQRDRTHDLLQTSDSETAGGVIKLPDEMIHFTVDVKPHDIDKFYCTLSARTYLEALASGVRFQDYDSNYQNGFNRSVMAHSCLTKDELIIHRAGQNFTYESYDMAFQFYSNNTLTTDWFELFGLMKGRTHFRMGQDFLNGTFTISDGQCVKRK